ncbi:cold shock domain-containing protein [Streptomyces sp. NPDC020875]|uniref:cold-shock protein n=1 Tax=Streptomyces sp. NPDC020875 TaxID=3154898 RepID=UPI0033F88D56
MVAGRVVRFDGMRGYGFIAPDHGGEDVFLHVNDLLIPEQYVRPGLAVEFEVEEGDRGLKASSVRLVDGTGAGALNGGGGRPSPAAGHGAVPAVVPSATRISGDGDDSLCDVFTPEELRQELTEVLLASAPSLTGEQLLQIRQALLQFGKNHGWTEG